ncbi:MAG: DUF87 domain-containing protein [Selenomonadaceae bacterium]|nr:DUF87 domain-containing protein [Selenomonadaceae bacterium]
MAMQLSDMTGMSSLLSDAMPEYGTNVNFNVFCMKEKSLGNGEVTFYKVQQLAFDEEYPHREAFENVLQSLENTAFNFIYLLDGDECGVNLYIGITKNQNENVQTSGKVLSAADYGKIIQCVFKGNFSGSKLEKVQGDDLHDLLAFSSLRFKNAGAIIGIPSVNEDKDNSSKYGFQGMDRLINSMMGCRWRIVIVCEPVSKFELLGLKNNIYEIYDNLAKYAKRSFQQSVSKGESKTTSQNSSEAKGANFSKNSSQTDSSGRQSGSTNSSHQTTKGDAYGESTTKTQGTGRSTGINSGMSSALTVDIISKQAQEIMKYIDEELLERVKLGFSKGMFKTSFYYMSDKPADANRLKSGIMAMFQGNRSSYSPLRAIGFDSANIESILCSYQNAYMKSDGVAQGHMTLLGHPHVGDSMGLATYMTAKEVSLIAGLPQKEIPGISVRESVDFGLNISECEGDIFLGNLMQKGRELPIPVEISRSVLNKHVFIAGVTGAGKTTTCHRLLQEANCPFLVIEPAKTEYRALIDVKAFQHVVVFTVGDETTAPFRINPFEIVPGENISAHIDMLKATFTSAFPMEASMPQILEEAICKVYEDKGWDIETGEYAENPSQSDAFPILSDFLKALEDIVDTKGFSERLRDDYRGSLISRFSNLTKGTKGAIFNCRRSVDFERLIRGNAVIEMENLKSSEDKSLLMGFLLARLSAVVKKRHEKNPEFRHITLVEEAHRLLSKPEYGDSGAKRTAVEAFTDLLAEIRKYGESLVIVDQIPNKLAAEVLKNTNTKIIHKIFARDDKEAVGDTMLMNDKQKEFLSALEPGQAIVFTEGLSFPVHVKICQVTDINDADVSNERVRARFMESYGEQFFHAELIRLFYPPIRRWLERIADEVLGGDDPERETIHEIQTLKRKIEEFFARAKESQAVEDTFDIEFLCREIGEELEKRMGMDGVFKKRAEAFLRMAFGDESQDYPFEKRETLRFLGDVKQFG